MLNLHSAHNVLGPMGEIHCKRDWRNTLCAYTAWYPRNAHEVLRQSRLQCLTPIGLTMSNPHRAHNV